jgi:hypothetical protein
VVLSDRDEDGFYEAVSQTDRSSAAGDCCQWPPNISIVADGGER